MRVNTKINADNIRKNRILGVLKARQKRCDGKVHLLHKNGPGLEKLECDWE